MYQRTQIAYSQNSPQNQDVYKIKAPEADEKLYFSMRSHQIKCELGAIHNAIYENHTTSSKQLVLCKKQKKETKK